MQQLTSYEQKELSYAQDSRLESYYNTKSVGLNDELNDETCDAHGNAKGSDFDLGSDGSFTGFTVLIGNFVSGANMNNPVVALKRKGFEVILEPDEKKFLEKINDADVAWIISGTDPTPKTKSPTSSGESRPAWTSVDRKTFAQSVANYQREGGSLFIWGDNDPLFEHANAVLPMIFDDKDVVLIGNTPGGNILSIGESATKGQFGPHIITSGIVNLYEGVTICYPKKLCKMKVLATSTDGNPVICYGDNEIFPSSYGRLVVDTGYTKNYISWQDAGAARYIVNATVWLLGLERKLELNQPLQGRKITKGKK